MDFLTVIYKNYKLLELQREQFDKLNFSDYRLIIVDNTPSAQRQTITERDNELLIIRENQGGEFDGVSHGSALDLGLTYCTSDIVCIFDSDYFFLQNIQSYIKDKFSEGYLAVGAEFWNSEVFGHFDKFSHLLENVPCCFCGFYKLDIIKKISWIVNPYEVDHSTSYVEVGYRIRKYINENAIKTFGWKCSSPNNMDNFVYVDEYNNPIGLHIVAGSHRNLSIDSKIKDELDKYESINITHIQ